MQLGPPVSVKRNKQLLSYFEGGSGIPELKNRVTNYEAIKPS